MPSSPSTYPRPDFGRVDSQWESLNGDWDFAFDNEDIGRSEAWYRESLPAHLKRSIQVPFVFQTPASQIHDHDAHEVIWYRIVHGSDWVSNRARSSGGRVLLRFGAVDYECAVWVNSEFVGNHRGGHVPFDLDITDPCLHDSPGLANQGSLHITIRVQDSPHDLTQPRGKQYWKPQPESIFYTPSSGIWQNVWLEWIPQVSIADGSGGTVLRSNDIDNGDLHATIAVVGKKAGQACKVQIEASLAGIPLRTSERIDIPLDKSRAQIDLNLRLTPDQISRLPDSFPKDNPSCWRSGLALWSPEHPLLYDLIISMFDSTGSKVDSIETTTGMRSLSWEDGDSTFRLNGEPYFHALVLDQGYWPETNMTPPSSEALKKDIELSKAMGFNGCRKHQKVEDPVFLYWADRLGYMVWGEMASAYEFDSAYTERFDEEWQAMVRRDINHPCVVAWTPANESWGYGKLAHNMSQRQHLRSIYYATKVIDPTRPINDNCGWEHVATDLTTFHDYADAPQLTELCSSLDAFTTKKSHPPLFVPALGSDPGSKHRPGAPVICTEFGGVNIAPSAESGERDWGYTTATDPEDLLKRLERLCFAVVGSGMCCGFVYTQLTDVEQEVNGLYTFDRQPKLEPARVKKIMDECRRMYHERRKRN